MIDLRLKARLHNFAARAKSQDAPPDSKPGDSYSEKLLRYIPSDIITAWVALTGILAQASADIPVWLSWAVFGALLSLTPFYVCFVKTDPPGLAVAKTFHWVTACIAFSCWVFALGGNPFSTLSWYKPVFGSIVVVLVTLLIPVLERYFVRGVLPPSSGAGSAGNGGAASSPPGSGVAPKA